MPRCRCRWRWRRWPTTEGLKVLTGNLRRPRIRPSSKRRRSVSGFVTTFWFVVNFDQNSSSNNDFYPEKCFSDFTSKRRLNFRLFWPKKSWESSKKDFFSIFQDSKNVSCFRIFVQLWGSTRDVSEPRLDLEVRDWF